MYMYLKVLSDPWRRGFRQRTGTSVQAVHEKKKKLNFTTKFTGTVCYTKFIVQYN